MRIMDALVVTSDGESASPWMRGLTEEFIEDPYCRLVLVDSKATMLVTIWESDMAAEVEQGLAGQGFEGVRLRRMKVIDPRNPTGMV
jgi:hypothetical protein